MGTNAVQKRYIKEFSELDDLKLNAKVSVLPPGLTKTCIEKHRCCPTYTAWPGAIQVRHSVKSLFDKGSYAMTRQLLSGNSILLGFDAIEQMLERLTKNQTDGYPPYNIERTTDKDGSRETFRITLAVAGFSADQLEVVVENNQLIIRGKQTEDKSRIYLHRGIAARQFQRAFVLADGLEVVSAQLDNGLLIIDLVRPESDKIIRQIEIVQK